MSYRGFRGSLPHAHGMEDRPEDTEELKNGVTLHVIGGSAPRGWEPVEEDEVVRLEKKGLPGVRTIEAADRQGPPTPESPRRRKRAKVTSRHVSFGLAGLVVTALVGTMIWVVGRPGPSPEPGVRDFFDQLEVGDVQLLGSGDAWGDMTAEYLEQARRELELLASLDDRAAIAERVRDGVRLQPFIEERWVRPALKRDDIMMMALDFGGKPEGQHWVALEGDDLHGERQRYVFVPSEEGVEFDWAASVGFNPVGLDALGRSAFGAEGEYRLKIGVADYYDLRFPEAEYRCYRVSDESSGEIGWAYAPVDSAAARQLDEVLGAGGTILQASAPVRFMVRLRKPQGALARQFELTEVLAPHWIRWEEKG